MTAAFDRRTFILRGTRVAGALVVANPAFDLAGRFLQDPELPTGGSRNDEDALDSAPAIVSRAKWGADETRRGGAPRFHPIRKLVIHHTVTDNDESDPAARLREIYDMHLRRGWADVGYNYVIDERGRVYEGRWSRAYGAGETVSAEDPFRRGVGGSHTAGANAGTMGVALLGTFMRRPPTRAALASLLDLITWKCRRHGLDPEGAEPFTRDDGQVVRIPTIVGHRDLRNTECPGDALYALLPQIRRRVADTRGNDRSAPSGYRILYENGMVVSRGDASDGRLAADVGASSKLCALAVPRRADGFWAADIEGGVFAMEGAPYRGSIPSLGESTVGLGRSPIVDIAGSPSGRGYWLVDREGGVFTFGDARFHGSIPALRAAGQLTDTVGAAALAPTRSGRGYWILDRAGGVFAFGDARFHGSIPSVSATGGEVDAVDLTPINSGRGYWILDRAGGVFSFGRARYFGSAPDAGFDGARARRLVASGSGRGYYVVCADGAVLPFGDAPFHGHGPRLAAVDLMATR